MSRPVDPRHDRVQLPDRARERRCESYYFPAYDFRHGGAAPRPFTAPAP